MARLRLHKYIANCGVTSRRRAELLIQAGRVQVNGKVLTSLGTVIDPDKDRVLLNGEVVRPPPRRTLAFSKPAGIITSTHDTHDRLTVVDLLPQSLVAAGVVPAGRLDQDTEGLLILTNDGDLAHRITHPRHETEKEYEAWVAGAPSPRSLQLLRTGIRIEGGVTAPARVEVAASNGSESCLRITIREGRKRQVRRMCQAAGHEVLRLRRTRIGGLLLGDLASGEWRELGEEEIALLLAPPPGRSEGGADGMKRCAGPR